ncbi:MAG: hypothetical protein ACPHID_04885 [Thermoplasmatota archaeon]
MSKAHFVHWRYIAVKMDGPKLSRRELNKAVMALGRKRGLPEGRWPSLTRYEYPHAIIRVQHMDAWACRQWLAAGLAVKDGATPATLALETLSSSGTIKTLTERLGILLKR